MNPDFALQAAFEQQAALYRDAAQVVAAYYKGLHDNGVPDQLASQLTGWFAHGYISGLIVANPLNTQRPN